MKRGMCVLGLACLLAGLAQAQDQAAHLWDQAMNAFEAKRFGAAVDFCREFEKVKPGTAEAPYTIAVARWMEAYLAVHSAPKVSQGGGTLSAPQRAELRARWVSTLTDGHVQVQRALAADPSYTNAIIYDSLLYRLEAELAESDSAANVLQARADARVTEALRTQGKQANRPVSLWRTPPPPPPPPPPAKKP